MRPGLSYPKISVSRKLRTTTRLNFSGFFLYLSIGYESDELLQLLKTISKRKLGDLNELIFRDCEASLIPFIIREWRNTHCNY